VSVSGIPAERTTIRATRPSVPPGLPPPARRAGGGSGCLLQVPRRPQAKGFPSGPAPPPLAVAQPTALAAWSGSETYRLIPRKHDAVLPVAIVFRGGPILLVGSAIAASAITATTRASAGASRTAAFGS
jgi:hypothetical protein